MLLLFSDFCDDKALLGEMFLTLSKLAVRNEFCQEIMDLGGLRLMHGALENCLSDKVRGYFQLFHQYMFVNSCVLRGMLL